MAQIETFEGLPIVDTGGRSLIAKKISFPNDGADFGNSGDQLRSLGNGEVEWAAPGMPTYEQTEQAISDWLNDHPEATTTVVDGAITDAKLNDALKSELIYNFETVAVMKTANTLKAGMVCHTNGFHASGDGGAAWYKIASNGTANEMDVIACENSLIAEFLPIEEYICPEQFGAYGDGIEDDTEVFKRVFEIAQYNCKIVLYGQYLITEDLAISSNDMMIVGFGVSSYRPKLIFSGTSTSLTVTGFGFYMENVLLVGDYDKSTSTYSQKILVLSRDSQSGAGNIDARIRGCYFGYAGSFIEIHGKNVVIEDCVFSEHPYSSNCIELYPLTNTYNSDKVYRGYIIRNNRFHGVGVGVRDFITDYFEIHNLLIEDNFFDFSCRIYIGISDGVTIKGNIFNQSRENGALIMLLNTYDKNTSCMIADNKCDSLPSAQDPSLRVKQNFRTAIDINGNCSGYFQISNNVFKTEYTSGYLIEFKTASGAKQKRIMFVNNILKSHSSSELLNISGAIQDNVGGLIANNIGESVNANPFKTSTGQPFTFANNVVYSSAIS